LADDITLDDLVSAFRLELRDGLAKLDTLGKTLAEFETTAKAGFTRVSDTADTQGKRMATAVGQGLQTALSHVGRFVVGLIGVGGLLEALRRVGDAFVTENKQQEEYTNRLQGVVGSAGAAAGELQRLEAFAAKTGLGVGELVDAYVLLRQRGIAPTNEALTALGNAAVTTNTGIASVANVMMYATQDAGRGLKQFGIEMTQAGAKTTFVWADAAGQIRKTIVDSTDATISATLLAIWNEKYAGRMDDFALSWSGMWGRLKAIVSQALTEIGAAGAWTEMKAQLAGFMGQLQALKGEDFAVWAKATSDSITPLIRLFGGLASAIMQVPLAAQALGDLIGRTFANIITFVEKGILAMLNTARVALSLLPAQKGQVDQLDRAIVVMKGAIADTTFAASDLDKQMHANLTTMVGMQMAGTKAADGVRQLASSHQQARPMVDALTERIRQANSAFDQEGDALLKLYGVFNETTLQDKMAELVDQAYKLHEHGVPANEILAKLGPSVKALADTYTADFQDKFTMPADFDRLQTAVGTGKVSVDDFLAYMDDQAWAKLKKGAQDSVIEIGKAGGGIAEALKGGFGKGIDESLIAANQKVDSWITVQASKKITIAVDISDMDLAAKLSRLGYTPKGMPNTAGVNR
jgi:hypothetical protein